MPRSHFAKAIRHVQDDIANYARIERSNRSTRFLLTLFLLTPGFQFVFLHRIQQMLVGFPVVGRLLRRIVWWMSCMIFGSEIAPSAEIAGGLYIPHPYGIVIGRCTIGRNAILMQHVTIGNRGVDSPGAPSIGNDCALGAGCAILGDITIGDNVQVGANSVVLRSVAAHLTVVGVPANVVGTGRYPVEDLGHNSVS